MLLCVCVCLCCIFKHVYVVFSTCLCCIFKHVCVVFSSMFVLYFQACLCASMCMCLCVLSLFGFILVRSPGVTSGRTANYQHIYMHIIITAVI